MASLGSQLRGDLTQFVHFFPCQPISPVVVKSRKHCSIGHLGIVFGIARAVTSCPKPRIQWTLVESTIKFFKDQPEILKPVMPLSNTSMIGETCLKYVD